MEQLTNIVPGWPRMVAAHGAGIHAARARRCGWHAPAPRARHGRGRAASRRWVPLVLRGTRSYWDVYLDQLSLRPDARRRRRRCRRRAWRRPPPSRSCCSGCRCSVARATPQRAGCTRRWPSSVCWSDGLGCRASCSAVEPLFAFVEHGDPHRAAVPAACGGALTLRTDVGIAALLVERWRRRCHGAAAAAGGDRRAAGRRRARHRIRAPRHASASKPRCRCSRCSSMIVFVAFVWINAARGERADRLRRQAERALRLSEERNQLIVETALDGVIMIDRQGHDHRLEHAGGKDVRLVARRGAGARARRAGHSRARPRGAPAWHAPLHQDRHGARAQQAHRDGGDASRGPRIPGRAGHHADRLRRGAGVQRVHPRHHRPQRGPKRRCAKASCASAPPPTPRRCSSG